MQENSREKLCMFDMYHLGEEAFNDCLLFFLTKLNKEDCFVVVLPFFVAISMEIGKKP